MAVSLTTVTKVATIPSVFSEMDDFSGNETHENYATLRWGVDLSDRVYTGGMYVTNEVFTVRNGSLTHLGRMSLPKPIKMNGDSGTDIVTAAAADDYGSSVSGDIDGDSTFDKRYYRVAWATENTAPGVVAIGADDALDDTDATHPDNNAPIGGFGPLSDIETEVTLAAGNTVVNITDVPVSVPADYPITHAYIFASDAKREDGGAYYFVGKMEYSSSTFSTLRDTLSWDVLVNRAQHVEDFLPTPTFTKAVRWGGRMVGITGGEAQVSTAFSEVFASVTEGSKQVIMTDNTGSTLTSRAWPRWMEHGGALIQFGTDSRVYEVDQVDEGDRYRLWLVTPYEGTTDNNARFVATATNDLFLCVANLQQQEMVRGGFILDGSRLVGAPLVSLIPDPYADSLLLFTRNQTWVLRGLPPAESITSALPFSGEVTRVSQSYGVAGANCVCVGPDAVYGLSDTALLKINSAEVADITEDVIREWIRQRGDDAKRKAVLNFDPVRKLILACIGDDTLVFDTVRSTFTVWENGRWRYTITATARSTGNTGEGGGPKLLFQTSVGDLVMMDEALSVDNVNTDTDDYAHSFEVTGVVSSVIITVDVTDGEVSPANRSVAMITTGANRGSYGELDLTATVGGAGFTVRSWTDGAPSVGDTVTLGAIRCRYQTGAFVRDDATLHTLATTRLELESDSTDTSARVFIELFGGGETSLLPDPDANTTSRSTTLGAIRSRIDIPLPRVSQSRRQGYGLDWIEPEDDGLRWNSIEILTDEEDR
jgi:hypothetical protein